MFLQLILVSFIGFIALYILFGKTRAAHIFWIVYASVATLSNIVFYNQVIAYKTRFSGDRWSLLQDLYVLILAEIFILLIVGLVWRFSRKERTVYKPEKPFVLQNRHIAIFAPLLFVLFAILMPYAYASRYIYSDEENEADVEQEMKGPEKPVEELLYTNKEGRYTLHYPSNCTIEEAGCNVEIALNGANHLKVTYVYEVDAASLEEQIKERMKILDGSTTFFEKRERIIAGIKGVEMEYILEDVLWHLHETTIDLDTALMVVQSRSTNAADYEKNHAMFEKMIDWIRFEK